jgi:hypothetical protein
LSCFKTFKTQLFSDLALTTSPSENSIDSFCNRYGSLRLKPVQSFFGLKTEVVGSYIDKKGFLKEIKAKIQLKSLKNCLNEIVKLYVYWRDFAEFMPVKFNFKDQKIIDTNDINTTPELYKNYLLEHGVNATSYLNYVFYDGVKSEWSFIKSCKRGNDVYIKEIKKKFQPLIEAEPKIFFDTTLNFNRKRPRLTPLIYVTATIDHKKVSLENSWLNFGSMFNIFITKVRKRFGKVDYLRTWQSQENGFPHWHGLFYFNDFNFSAVYNLSRNLKPSWRIASRQKLHKGDELTVRQRLKKAWKYGNLDIICVDNTQDCFKDLLKYVTRDLEGGESDLTNALVWYFEKQSFAVSKDFFDCIIDKKEGCIDLAEPSNADLINDLSYNSNSDLVSIEVFPVLPASFFRSFYQATLKDWAEPPDPPPELIRKLELLCDECSVKYSVRSDGVKIICYSLRRG